jgi:hypothetical protein
METEEDKPVRKKLVIVCYALAAAYGLWRGIRIAFFPIAMMSTLPANGGAESIQPTFIPERIPIFIVILLVYGAIGYALYMGAINAFRIMSIGHIALSLLSLPSVGSLFLPSSLLLLIAVLLSIGAYHEATEQPLTRRTSRS